MADTRSLEDRIRDCKSASELQELCTASRTFQGSFSRNADGSTTFVSDGFMPSAPAPAQEPVKPASDGSGMFRSLFQMPDGRIQVAEGYSEEGLGMLEDILFRQGAKLIRRSV